MKNESNNVFEIITYDNKILKIELGKTYKAIGTSGIAKDTEVVGVLRRNESFKSFEIVDKRGRVCAINDRTIQPL